MPFLCPPESTIVPSLSRHGISPLFPFTVSCLTQQGSPVSYGGLWQQRSKLFRHDDSVSDLSLCPWPSTEPSILNSKRTAPMHPVEFLHAWPQANPRGAACPSKAGLQHQVPLREAPSSPVIFLQTRTFSCPRSAS